MRYTLDSSGFVFAVAFGSYLDNCREYTGEVPAGYRTLYEWATYACIQAYYIDSNGNLVLDSERLEELQYKQAQEAIDYAPLVRKDLFEHNEVLDSQYVRQTASGKVIVLEDIKTLAPRVKLTNVQPYEYDKITIHTQGKNMLPCIAKTETVEGVKFTKNMDGSLSVVGTALQDIEYVVAESDRTIFSLKANENYFLNLGGLNCEMRFVDNGEISQQYVGASGLINVPQHIEVSQVVIKIEKLESVNTTFYPQLEYGESFSSYAEYKCKTFEIDLSNIVERYLYPSDNLFPSDTLLLKEVSTIEYIIVKDNALDVSISGLNKLFAGGAFGLFSSYSTIYATKDIDLEIEYSTNIIDVNSLEFLQGKATTTNQFKILNDGSIEAHNGYFSGKVEADSGYFKGKIEADSGTFKGRIEAESGTFKGDITGGTINIGSNFLVDEKGNLIARNAEITGKIEADEGKIGGFTVTRFSIYSGYKSGFNYSSNGVYIGDEGISVGGSYGVKISSDGDIDIKSNGSIEFEYLSKKMKLDYEGISFGSSNWNTKVSEYEIKVGNSHMTNDEIKVGLSTSTNYYSRMKHNEVCVYSDYSRYSKLKPSELEFGSSDTFYFRAGTESIMALKKSEIRIYPPTLILGGTYLGFFGATNGATRQEVFPVTNVNSTTLNECATKLNKLIDALKAYNLLR